jgi:hypothetical protein
MPNITRLNNSSIPSTIQQSTLPNQHISTEPIESTETQTQSTLPNQQNPNNLQDVSTQFFDKKKKKKTIISTETDTENIVDIDILSKKKKNKK